MLSEALFLFRNIYCTFRSSMMLFLRFFTQLFMLFQREETLHYILTINRHQDILNTFPVQMSICVHFPIYRSMSDKIDEFFLTASQETV
jgi:hypothetical protein